MTRSQPSGPVTTHVIERLAAVLAAARDDLTTVSLTSLATQLERYDQLPDELLTGDVARIVRHNLELFRASLLSGLPPSDPELVEVGESAGARAQEGIPLPLVVRAYFVAARGSLEHVAQHTTVLQDGMPMDLVLRLLDFLESAVAAAADGYLKEHDSIQTALVTTNDRVLRSLLNGTVPSGDAGLGRYPMPPRFEVVAVHVEKRADADAPDWERTVVNQRLARRIRDAFAELADGTVLSSVNHEGGIVLVPIAELRGETDCSALQATLASLAERRVWLGHAHATPDQVMSTVQLARDVLEVALFSAREPGAYRLEDVLVEFGISRPGPTCDRLAAVLTPLEDHPELIETLRAYLHSDRNRRRAGRQLGIHPNTVDNRMRRLTALTGLELTEPAHVNLLTSAITARDAVRFRVGD